VSASSLCMQRAVMFSVGRGTSCSLCFTILLAQTVTPPQFRMGEKGGGVEQIFQFRRFCGSQKETSREGYFFMPPSHCYLAVTSGIVPQLQLWYIVHAVETLVSLLQKERSFPEKRMDVRCCPGGGTELIA
jgi:hypothetical protein